MADMLEKMAALVDRIEKLPTLSVVVIRLTELLASENASTKQVTQILSEDQSLTARILRLANSAFFGFAGRVATLQQAVVLLGFSRIRDVALSASVIERFSEDANDGGKDKTFSIQGFWEHGIATAVAARTLGLRSNAYDPEEGFVAGLLHDLGKLVMYIHMKPEFTAILAKAKEDDCLFLEAERPQGLCHASLGAALIQKWNLPRNLSDAVACHHSLQLARPTLALQAGVMAGDALARARGIGLAGDHRIPVVHRAAWQALGIEEADLPAIIASFDENMSAASVFLELLHD